MRAYVKLVVGLLLIVSVLAGTKGLLGGDFEEASRRIVENGIDTTGVIDSRSEHIVVGRFGKIAGAGRYYTLKYSFSTLDGQKYSDEINVSQEQAYSAQDGQEIRVRYYKNQPSINSAMDFQEYMTEDDVKNMPVGTFIVAYLIMLLGGAWLTYSSWKTIRPASTAAASNRRSVRASTTGAAVAPRRPVRAGGKAGFGRR